MMVGKGKGTAVVAASVPVPLLLKNFKNTDTRPSPNLLFRYTDPPFASQAEGGVRAGYGTGGRDSSAFVPWCAMTAGQESDQKVRAAEGGNRRAVQHGEKEKPERSEVPEYGGEPHARNYSKAFVSNE